ncbi:TPA: replication initiation protein [Mannheimia haemolytica]
MSSDLTIVKANSFVQASYSMTLDEMRILSLTLGVFNPENPSKRDFEFTVDEFCKHFPDVNPDIAYTQVQNAIRKISRRWMTLRDDEYMLDEVVFVTDRTYFKKEGRFRIMFHERLMPYIAELHNRFTKYKLVNIGTLSSTHSIRLYELCSQYRDKGWRQTTVDDLKEWLQITDKYPRYNSFNQRVLTPAVDEINAKTDLLVSVEPVRKGRAVTALKFIISVKDQHSNLTKDGLTNLSLVLDRTQFKQAGEYERECIKIRKADVERLENEGRTVPDKAYEQLGKWYRVIGDKDLAQKYEKLAGKDKPSKPQKAVEPDRFSYLLDTLKNKDHTRETAKELLELSRVDGVNPAHKNLAERKYKQIMEHLDAKIVQEVSARAEEYFLDNPDGFNPNNEPNEPLAIDDEEDTAKILAEIKRKQEELDLLLEKVFKGKNKTA